MIGANVGKSSFYGSPIVLDDEISTETIVEAFSWFDKVRSIGPSVAQYSILVFELFSLGEPLNASRRDIAWPRPKNASHYLMISAGFDAGIPKEQESKVVKEVIDGPAEILGPDYPRRFVPNFVEKFHDMKVTYGEHYEKLRRLKQEYDPGNKLPSSFWGQ